MCWNHPGSFLLDTKSSWNLKVILHLLLTLENWWIFSWTTTHSEFSSWRSVKMWVVSWSLVRILRQSRGDWGLRAIFSLSEICASPTLWSSASRRKFTYQFYAKARHLTQLVLLISQKQKHNFIKSNFSSLILNNNCHINF